MGAWIEIVYTSHLCSVMIVAPPVGAWIEIMITLLFKRLKQVAPPVGAWIEIVDNKIASHCCSRRSPRGSVD